jgi:SAM-dependent methyltransferase
VLKSGSILDVGCGTGALALRLAGEGYEVSGVDASLGMLRECVKKGFSRVSHAESGKMPFAPGSFDLVMSVAAFHHLGSRENVAAAAAEMFRVCRPGGKILIWDNNPLNPYWKIFMKRLPWDGGVERLIPAKEICAALRSAGGENIRVYKLGFVADFIPRALLPAMKSVEEVLERLPGARALAAHNVILAEKGE